MAQRTAKSVEVTFPYEVVEREARRNRLPVEEFVRQFQVVAHFDDLGGVFYTFERVDKEKNKEAGRRQLQQLKGVDKTLGI
jgi:hypothetical protein